MTLLLDDIRATAADRPSGYYEDVLSRGLVSGGVLELPESAYLELCAKYSPLQPAGRPDPALVVTALADTRRHHPLDLPRWEGAGRPIFDQAGHDRRLAICAACVDRVCGQCACTRLNRWLPTQDCPLGKWAVKPALPGL
jgi:hypothetical protein